MYPEPTMVQKNRYFSPVISSIPDEDMDSSTESDVSWLGPQNQLGLEPGEQFGSRWDDEEEALDDEGEALDEEFEGEIKNYEAIAKY
jgi:hypothetical protein